jgi:CO/xanthine dehydrogenase FAD-binding subunit
LQAFDYVAAHSIAEAATFLARHNGQARVMAGGTDLLVQMREGRRAVDLVVDIKPIPEANELRYDPADGLWIGAAVPCLRIRDNAAVAQAYPGLVDAVSLVGGVQIQGRATIGGNLSNASPAADTIPALIVHRATCEVAGPDGLRQVPVEGFCTGPGQTILQRAEFLVRLHIPPPQPGFGAHYLRFTPRNEMDIAVAGVGAAVTLDDTGTVIRAIRVALGAVAPVPLFVPEIGEALTGRRISEETIDAIIKEAAELAREAARPISDMRGSAAQRKHLAMVLTGRALRKAIERARASLEGA